MPTVTLTIDGDASDGVAAAQEAAGALTSLGGAGAAASTGLDNIGRTGLVASSSARGLKMEAAEAGNILQNFGQAASMSGGLLGVLGPQAAGAGNAIAQIGTAAAIGFSTLGPWGAALGAASTGLAMITGSGGGAAEQMTAVQMAAAESKAEMELLAKDSQLVFSGVPGSAGVARNEVMQTAAAFLNASNAAGGSSGAAEGLASSLFDVVGASDQAAQSASRHATMSELLAASQKSTANAVLAVAGGLAQVSSAYSDATSSAMAYQAASGTYGGGTSNSLEGRAGGGPVTAGTPYMVGEGAGSKGELFVPSESGYIYPQGQFPSAGASATVGGGGGNTYVLNIGTIIGLMDLERTVKAWMREESQYQTGLRGYLQTAS